MSIYIWGLFNITIFSIINTRFYKTKDNLGRYNTNNLGVGFAIIMLSLIGALRWDVGTDFDTYLRIFTNIQHMTFIEALSKDSEVLFNILTWIVMKITGNTQVVFALYSILTIYIIVLSLRDYSSFFPLSLYLYIVGMSYFSSFNGIRQWLAAAIIFYGYKYMCINRKKYFGLVIIATLFHNSAIIMIPISYIVKRKFFSKINVIIGLASITFTLFFHKFLSLFLSLLALTRYGNYLTWFEIGGKGSNPMRFLLSLVPFLFSIINYKKLKNKREDIDILINLSFLNAIIMMISSRDWIFARFTPYFDVYNLILIPEFLNIKNRYLRYLILLIVITIYFIVMLLLLPRESNLLPYNSIIGK